MTRPKTSPLAGCLTLLAFLAFIACAIFSVIYWASQGVTAQ